MGIAYGPEKLTYRELDSSEKNTAVMKFITAPLAPRAGEVSLSKAERLTKKNLLRLSPWNYFKESSNPQRRLEERAELQSVKPQIDSMSHLMAGALKELQLGQKTNGLRCLHRIKQCLKRRKRWFVPDHLLMRYVLWAVSEIERAKRVLYALGLGALELSNPLLTGGFGRPLKQLQRPRLFVVDKGYTNGDPMDRHIVAPLLVRIP
jgi:hypothetical protein